MNTSSKHQNVQDLLKEIAFDAIKSLAKEQFVQFVHPTRDQFMSGGNLNHGGKIILKTCRKGNLGLLICVGS